MEIDRPTHYRAQFLAWMRDNYPDLYQQAMMTNQPNGIGGFFDSLGSAFNNVVKNVTNALPQLANTYSQYRQQEQLIKMNAERARQGLPVLSVGPNGQLVDLTGQTYTADDFNLARTGGLSTTSILMIAVALGLGLILVLKR